MSYEDRISIPTPEGVDLDLTLAGVGSRCLARLIDQFLQTVVMLALGLLAVALGAVAGGGRGGSASEGGAVAVSLVLVAVFLVQFGYDVLFETLASGRSPGKRWTGLRVVRVDGGPVGFVTAAVRNLLRIVDFLPAMYGVAIVAVVASSRNQRLGDMAAATLVVRERGQEPATPPRPWMAAEPWGNDDLRGWDVSAVTPEEASTVRRFLERRPGLTAAARGRLGADLAGRLRRKVVGHPETMGDEDFLEAVVRAKAARS